MSAKRSGGRVRNAGSARRVKPAVGDRSQQALQLEAAELSPCPRCGKFEGKVCDTGAGRFPWFVQCDDCPWATDHVRNRPVAVKLWNEAKLAPKRLATTRLG